MRLLYFCCTLAALGSLAGEPGLDPSAIPRLTPLNEPPAPEKFARAEGLTSTATLQLYSESTTPRTIIIDARDAAAFRLGHIPGARNIQSDLFQAPDLPPYFLPPAEALKRICAQEGVGAGTRVVIYDQEDGRLAARIWFTFHAYGHAHVSILNGGLNRWLEEKRGISTAQPTLDGSGTFEPAAQLRGVCTSSEIPRYGVRGQAIGRLPTVTLLDARTRAEYMGEDARGKLSGHIPGAANLPWSTMLTSAAQGHLWRSPQEIHALLRIANVDRGAPIAIYDQAGGRSAHLYFTLWLMGFDSIANYVAGWREYGNRIDVEIEK